MSEFVPNVADSNEKLSTRFKRSVGRAAVRAMAVIAGAGAVFSGVVAAESATGHEDAAQAYHVTGAEKAWCRVPSRWNLCNQAFAMADVAEQKSRKAESENSWDTVENGKGNAVQHCVWNGLMAANFGRTTAAGFGNRHEYDGKQRPEERDMDLHNNLKGRDWATADLGEMASRCIEGVENGKLISLNG